MQNEIIGGKFPQMEVIGRLCYIYEFFKFIGRLKFFQLGTGIIDTNLYIDIRNRIRNINIKFF